jgi:hypothetical protein
MVSLERVLEAWLDMMEKGKIVATPEAGNVEASRILVPYSEQILKETIDVFNRLVQEIGIRFPSGGTNRDDGTSGEDGGPFLIDETILDTNNPRRVSLNDSPEG